MVCETWTYLTGHTTHFITDHCHYDDVIMGVSNHLPHDCLLNRLFRRRSKRTSKLSGTGLCAGNSPVIGEFPAQMASYAENASIWWRHHGDSGRGKVQNIISDQSDWWEMYTICSRRIDPVIIINQSINESDCLCRVGDWYTIGHF